MTVETMRSAVWADEGEQEQHGLEALAGDRHERQPGEGGDRSSGERDVDALLELALHRPALASHPEQHPGQDRHRDHAGRPSRVSCTRERQAADRERDDQADAHRERERRDHAHRDAAEGIAAADLDQVGADDPDDERGLETFAEQQEERGSSRRGALRSVDGSSPDGLQVGMTRGCKALVERNLPRPARTVKRSVRGPDLEAGEAPARREQGADDRRPSGRPRRARPGAASRRLAAQAAPRCPASPGGSRGIACPRAARPGRLPR